MGREAVAVESGIEQVTVYARGARVRRSARVGVPGDGVVRFVGLPLSLIDDSVRVEVEGAAVVTAVRAGFDVPSGEPADEETPDLRAANRRVALAETEVERVARALEQLAGAPVIADDPSEEPPAAWSEMLAARRALLDQRGERERALRERHAEARRELADARRAYEVAAERDARSGSARAAKLHEVRKHVELDVQAPKGEVVLRVEYQVAAARWAPSYVARLETGKASWELRAVVAQDSGEDWTGVALRLSTAEPDRFAELPELVPQKIGRRQPEPAKRGFRPPPAGAEALYADYQSAFPSRGRPPTFGADSVRDDSTFEGRVPRRDTDAELATEVWDESSALHEDVELDHATVRQAAPRNQLEAGAAAPKTATLARRPAPMVPPPAAAFPLSGPMGSVAPEKRKREAFEDVTRETYRAEPSAQLEVRRLDYGNLVMAPPSSFDRGRLVPAPPPAGSELVAQIGARAAAIAHLVLPPGCFAEWSHAYDYAFASDGTVDVRSDGAWHSLALTARAGTASLRHVAVPREQADVFRIATLGNPFDGPLLPGPVDVYDRGQFLVTSAVEFTPPGTSVELGLGVDPSVKIARNVEFREEAAGMLRGTLRLHHSIAIEVENLSARPIEIEVRERVPVAPEGDDEIEVALAKVDPAWERFTPDPDAPADAKLRGGYRWRVPVAAGKKQLLRAGYEIKIAGKLELVGGNRREP